MIVRLLDRLIPGLQVLPSARRRVDVLTMTMLGYEPPPTDAWQRVPSSSQRLSVRAVIVLSALTPIALIIWAFLVVPSSSAPAQSRPSGGWFLAAIYVPAALVLLWDVWRRFRMQVRLVVNGLGYPVCHVCGTTRAEDRESECPRCGAHGLNYRPSSGTVVFDNLREMPELLCFQTEDQAAREYARVLDLLDPPWKHRMPVIVVLSIGVAVGGFAAWWLNMPRRTPDWVDRTVSVGIIMAAFSVTPVYLTLWIRTVRRQLRRRLDALGLWPRKVWVCGKCGYDLTGIDGRACPECGSKKRRARLEQRTQSAP